MDTTTSSDIAESKTQASGQHDKQLAAIVDYLRAGIHNTKQLGIELEHILINTAENRPLTYGGDPGVATLLHDMSEEFPQKSFDAGNDLLGVGEGKTLVTIEPASQLEISAGPFDTLQEMAETLEQFEQRLDRYAGARGARVELAGYNPYASSADLPLIPKRRYAFMDAYFEKIGPYGRAMMRGSAATQVSIDYHSEEDCLRKTRLACILTPLLSLITDNSPIFEGKLRPHALMRTKIWNECDPDGILPFIDKADASFADYAEYLLSVPAILAPCTTDEWCASDKSFGELYAQTQMTTADIEHALSMLFTDVRIKHYVEIRPADALPVPVALGYAALIKGLFYSEEVLERLLDDFSSIRIPDILAAKEALMQEGYEACVYGKPAHTWVRTLLSYAREGLDRDELAYLAPLADLMRSGETLAERKLKQRITDEGEPDNRDMMLTVSYKGYFDDGAVFIDQREPIDFPCCEGWMPPVFIDTTAHMGIGETRRVHVSANEAYEEHTEERIIRIERSKLPDGIISTPIGEMVNLEDPTGQTYPAKVVEITPDEIIFDMNHDAICKALNFEITLLRAIDLADTLR